MGLKLLEHKACTHSGSHSHFHSHLMPALPSSRAGTLTLSFTIVPWLAHSHLWTYTRILTLSRMHVHTCAHTHVPWGRGDTRWEPDLLPHHPYGFCFPESRGGVPTTVARAPDGGSAIGGLVPTPCDAVPRHSFCLRKEASPAFTRLCVFSWDARQSHGKARLYLKEAPHPNSTVF